MAAKYFLLQNNIYENQFICVDIDAVTKINKCINVLKTCIEDMQGGRPRVVVSTAAFHARVRGSVPGPGGLKETKNVSSPSTCES